MDSLINKKRPPLFCPGCSHEKVVGALDKAFCNMEIVGDDIVMVSDIGCSGLFDTFFNTHAFHGLHGRALTYAAGIKMANPKLNVVVTMGDGGLGIGGAHLLEACRRNLDITLLVLNNFNFGMTGGQFSSTTPEEAIVGSGFLNNLEKPFDVCQTGIAAGASFATRCSGYIKNLDKKIEDAVKHKGFSIMDIWGVCPGRFTKRNRLTPKLIEEKLQKLPAVEGAVKENIRKEYTAHYKEIASALKPVSPVKEIKPEFKAPEAGKHSVIILGSAGQRIITAGEILCYAGLKAGLFTTLKSDYNITVLRGHSISEAVLSDNKIQYIGSGTPAVILAVDKEGITRKEAAFKKLNKNTLIITGNDMEIPDTNATIFAVDFKKLKIKSHERALASLAVMALHNRVISYDMLISALKEVFNQKIFNVSFELTEKIKNSELI
ncbi:MAG: 2-oxoacid:acceptor oxidoreductase family protein [Deltaproteobacteria bacterium]|nr:2-oxoacid:acceptor oxidoreductase family protein [Deltaproteobacteria bacterium]